LEDLGLGQYADAFDDNALDLNLVGDLSDGDLKDLGVAAMGHRNWEMSAYRARCQNPAHFVPAFCRNHGAR
jgi:hypothetical protein